MKIGIVGAGLLGRLMAWRLLRQGHEVHLFDRDSAAAEQSAAKVAAAMIAPFSEVVNCEREVFDWGLQALTRWPQLLRELHSESHREVYFQHRGSVVVAHPQDQAYLDHFNQMLRSRVPDREADYQFLDQQALAQLEPSLAGPFRSATFLQQEACLDNWGLLDTLSHAITALGGEWLQQQEITAVLPRQIATADQQWTFDQVIDCRGVGARVDHHDLRGVRGEVLWVRAPEVNLSRPVRLMHPRYQLYIAPKPDQRYVIGATEIESDSMRPITVRSSLELQSALYSVDRGFAEASIEKAYANCRPAFADNLPRIENQPGLMHINGLYRHGYLLSPVVIDAAMAALAGDTSHRIVITAEPTTYPASA